MPIPQRTPGTLVQRMAWLAMPDTSLLKMPLKKMFFVNGSWWTEHRARKRLAYQYASALAEVKTCDYDVRNPDAFKFIPRENVRSTYFDELVMDIQVIHMVNRKLQSCYYKFVNHRTMDALLNMAKPCDHCHERPSNCMCVPYSDEEAPSSDEDNEPMRRDEPVPFYHPDPSAPGTPATQILTPEVSMINLTDE